MLGKYMKKIGKRAAVTTLGLIVTLLLAACGGDKGNVASDDQAKQGVFREKDNTGQVSEIMTEDSNVAAMAFYDNILYMIGETEPTLVMNYIATQIRSITPLPEIWC